MAKFDGFTQPVMAVGVVEDRKDPLKIGRCRVRWFGLHREDKQRIPTESLPWAQPIIPQGSNSQTLPSYKEGDMVVGMFFDGTNIQQPFILGVVHGFPEDVANPDLGFNDPTSDEDLTADKQPRPPFMGTQPEELEEDALEGGGTEGAEGDSGKKDPDKLPQEGTAFGMLASEFREDRFTYDMNGDGVYNNEDAAILQANLNKDFIILADGTIKFADEIGEIATLPMSRYPLEPLLKLPDTNAFELGEEEATEHLQFQTVQKMKGERVVAPVAEHESTGIGTDKTDAGEPFNEEESTYKAQYPFNKTRYTESGHVISVDDTPKHERMEVVHRAGTFLEVGPTGKTTTKVKKDHLHFVLDNYLVYSGKSTSISAKAKLNLLGEEVVNISSAGNINHDCESMANNIKADLMTKVGNNVYVKTEGDLLQLFINNEVQILCKDKVSIIVEDDLLINGEKNVKIAAKELLQLEGNLGVNIVAATQVGTTAPFTTLGGITTGNIFATTAEIAGTINTIPPIPPLPVIGNVDAVAEFDEGRLTENADAADGGSSSPQPGYVLDGPGNVVWKPVSDTKPNAVSLSLDPSQHYLYEAVPTGELENVTIEYLNADGTITSWDVVRPVHKRGKLIEAGRNNGVANGGRTHYVWRTVGSKYPQQMFLVIGGTEYLLLDAAVRHD